MELKLNHNKGFKWVTNFQIYFKGFIVLKSKYYFAYEALELFQTITNYQDLKDFLSHQNGMFTVIIKTKAGLLIGTDITRTFPLFWDVQQCVLTDDPYLFRSISFDQNSVKEYQATSFTCYDKTFFKGVLQTESSQILCFDEMGCVKKEFYTKYSTDIVKQDSKENLKNELNNIIINVFSDLVQSAKGRMLVVPLSGGLDSRLIVTMLKYYNYTNVVCFTFGIQDNEEENISKQVAEKLGYKWFFIDYNKIDVKDYLHTPQFKKYVEFSGKMTTFPYLQEYFAIQYIKENNLVNEDAIFLPGHSGDFLAGSHLKKKFNYQSTNDKIIGELLQNYYTVSNIKPPISSKETLKNWVEDQLGYSYSNYEEWVLKERQAKCIVNSSSIFDYFGYQYYLPLWDTRLVDYFKVLPIEYKNFQKLYIEVICSDFFSLYDLNFKKELKPSPREIIIQNYKEKIKAIIPKVVIKKMSDPIKWSAYDTLTLPMKEELKGTKYEQFIGRSLNSVIVNWYLFNLEKERNELQESNHKSSL